MPARRNLENSAHIYSLNYSQLSMMRRLFIGAALALTCFAVQAQDTLRPAPRRQAVDLQNYGVTKVASARPVTEQGDDTPGRTAHVVATGERTPLPTGYSRHKTLAKHSYITGPKGGCFYLNASGKKVYVDHSYCK